MPPAAIYWFARAISKNSSSTAYRTSGSTFPRLVRSSVNCSTSSSRSAPNTRAAESLPRHASRIAAFVRPLSSLILGFSFRVALLLFAHPGAQYRGHRLGRFPRHPFHLARHLLTPRFRGRELGNGYLFVGFRRNLRNSKKEMTYHEQSYHEQQNR